MEPKPSHVVTPWNAPFADSARIGFGCAWIITNSIGQLVAIVPQAQFPTKDGTAQRIVACVNACAGINPEAVPDILDALREMMADYIIQNDGRDDRNTVRARAAIAKATKP